MSRLSTSMRLLSLLLPYCDLLSATAAVGIPGLLEASCAEDSPLSLMQRGSQGLGLQHHGRHAAASGATSAAASSASATSAASASPEAGKVASRNARGKKCVIIASVAAHAAEIMSKNAEHVKEDCDFILGHYDQNTSTFVQRAWYAEEVVLAKVQPFLNKLDLVRELVKNNMDTLLEYEAALVLDDDMELSNLDMHCFVEWFVSSPYLIASPNAPSQDHYTEWDPSSCPVRVTDQITPTALLFKAEKLRDLADMVLPETLRPNGLIECDFGTVLVMCRWMAQKHGMGLLGTGGVSNVCAFADQCGVAIHTNIKSKWDQAHWDTCMKYTQLYITKMPGYVQAQVQWCSVRLAKY
mmetsp:Transcript_103251/g.296367  ORF Transcript_103251/g.296367 Transcript_103251/m.296367 type:complete len:354 (-) Transcript_103251:250-1311(-)